MAATLEHETFSKHLNSTFRITFADSNTLDLELSEIGAPQLSPQQERFAIVFRGPREPVLPQGSYRFEHAEMGELILFIVPLRQDDKGTEYEACFNRLRKGD